MRSWIFGAITLMCMSVASAASACPSSADESVRPTRPVVQNVSLQASDLMERASRLESVASSHDAQARVLEQEADTLSNRARILRSQAALVNPSDRPSILAIADELSARSASSRARAVGDRAQASELRVEARNLRQRAVALVRGTGGGSWRARPTTLTRSVAPPLVERGVTL